MFERYFLRNHGLHFYRKLRISKFIVKLFLTFLFICHFSAWSMKDDNKPKEKTEAPSNLGEDVNDWSLMRLNFYLVLDIISQLSFEDQRSLIFYVSKSTRNFFRNHFENSQYALSFLNALKSSPHLPRVSASYTKSFAIDKQGRLHSWGEEKQEIIKSKRHSDPSVETFFHAVAASNDHSLVLNNQGQVFSFGENTHGQLGLGDFNRRNSPTLITFPGNAHINFIAARGGQSFAIDREGRLYAWGENTHGQLGLGDLYHHNSPTLVSFPRNTVVVHVATGSHQSFAVDSEGRLYAWGENTHGQLGLGDINNRILPELVPLPPRTYITHVTSSGNHSLALDSEGRLYAWGENQWGQLGLGDFNSRIIPTLVPIKSNAPIFQIVSGGGHNLALDKEGRLYVWGRNYCGELGLEAALRQETLNTPTQVPLPANSQIVSLAAGSSHSLAMDNLGRLYVWGLNAKGQLGLRTDVDCKSPTLTHVSDLSLLLPEKTLSQALYSGLLPEALYDYELKEEIIRLRKRNLYGELSRYLNENNIFQWVYGEGNDAVDKQERMRLLRDRILRFSKNGNIILYIMGYGHTISLVIHNNIAYILEGLEANSQFAQEVLEELQSQQQALNLNSVHLINTGFQTIDYTNLCGVIAIHGGLGLLEALNNNQEMSLDGLRDSVRSHLLRNVEPVLRVSETTHSSQSSLTTPNAYSYVAPPLVAFILYLIFNYY